MSRVHKPILVEISPGELIDRITILQIKSQRMTDVRQQSHVQAELADLLTARQRSVAASAELDELTADLYAVNESLWQVEDALRQCEAAHDFGPRFVQLARSVYHKNDRRHALKRRINNLTEAKMSEEKLHPVY